MPWKESRGNKRQVAAHHTSAGDNAWFCINAGNRSAANVLNRSWINMKSFFLMYATGQSVVLPRLRR